MLERAENKIREEMNNSKKSHYVQVVGEMLLGYLKNNPNASEKILPEDKSIEKSLDEMRKVAETKKQGNYAVLSDQEGFNVVLKYFGLGDASVPLVSKPLQTNTEGDFNVNLEDLLL